MCLALHTGLRDFSPNHGAPMRDESVEEITSEITEGTVDGNMGSLVQGLEKLFSLLEVMKLDIANHQIRSHRAVWVIESIAFQQDYWRTQIKIGKYDVCKAREWYDRNCLALSSRQKTAQGGLGAIAYGLAQSCCRFEAVLPTSFEHEAVRLWQLQEDILDMIYLQICLNYSDQRLSAKRGHKENMPILPRQLVGRLLGLTDSGLGDGSSLGSVWHDRLNASSAEITRAVLAMSNHGIQTSADWDDANAFTRGSLQHKFEEESEDCQGAKYISQLLARTTREYDEKFQKMSMLTISEYQRHFQQARHIGSETRSIPDIEDVSRRLAHMAVVHWRVWHELLYS